MQGDRKQGQVVAARDCATSSGHGSGGSAAAYNGVHPLAAGLHSASASSLYAAVNIIWRACRSSRNSGGGLHTKCWGNVTIAASPQHFAGLTGWSWRSRQAVLSCKRELGRSECLHSARGTAVVLLHSQN